MASRRLTDHTNVDLSVKYSKSGGFGNVYFGPDAMSSGAWVALKTIKPELLAEPTVRERLIRYFINESFTWMSLWPHANILPARGVTIIEAQVFIILTFAKGGSLYDWLLKHNRSSIFPWSQGRGRRAMGQRLYWAQMIAAGLNYLHASDPSMVRGTPIIHGDLKPDNVLIQPNRLVQIADFGLARGLEIGLTEMSASAVDLLPSKQTNSKIIQTPAVMSYGAPEYKAPEQWTGSSPVDTYTDMYAFGLLLSELLAGRHALLDLATKHSVDDWRHAHLHQPPRPLKSTDASPFDTITLIYEKCLSKDPHERPTAHEALLVLRMAALALGHRAYDVPDIYPHTPEHETSTWQNLSANYARFGQYEKALDWNDVVLRLNPTHRNALLTRANILSQVGSADDTVRAYRAALAAIPLSDNGSLATVYYDYATFLGKSDRLAEAEDAFEKSLAAVPEAPDVWNNRGVNQMKWGIGDLEKGNRSDAMKHFDLGITYIKRARALNRRDPDYPKALKQMEGLRDHVLKLTQQQSF